MFRITPLRLLALAVAAIGGYFWPSIRWMMRVDACLDRGGAMDYARRVCTMTDAVPPPPPGSWYEAPSGLELWLVAGVLVVVAAVFANRDRMSGTGARAI
jgi:hypothetical protein